MIHYLCMKSKGNLVMNNINNFINGEGDTNDPYLTNEEEPHRPSVDEGVIAIIDTILDKDVQQLNEDSQRDDWSFIFKAAMKDPSGKAFTVDPRDPSTIILDLGYMPDWMTFNVMITIDNQPIILSLTTPEMQLVSMSQIVDWTQSVDCSYWLSTSDDSQGFDLVGALNDWSSLGMLQFKRTPRIDPSWTISLRFYDGV